ncbi:hypothetical protein ALP78_00286 [Pseudomonas coronafaciens pv. striafaciens]|uniref:Uncharacterized protein n=2 Tax=Pseudomonas TaxID=286 RepID=A0A3M4YY06_9PSED|nr:hypothetical protein ALP78_00286 [Pseudomonas coronafaciens pv. striafaciens]
MNNGKSRCIHKPAELRALAVSGCGFRVLKNEAGSMNSTYLEALEEFETLTGTPYRDELYLTPASVPAELLDVISKAKISQAHAQQISISHQMQHFKQGNVAVLPEDKTYLVGDFEKCREQIELWSAARSDRKSK